MPNGEAVRDRPCGQRQAGRRRRGLRQQPACQDRAQRRHGSDLARAEDVRRVQDE
jgi:hypothetical protein